MMPFPFPGDLPNSGIKPGFPALQADALQSEPPVVFHLDDRDAEGAVVTERVNESANGQGKASPKRRHL